MHNPNCQIKETEMKDYLTHMQEVLNCIPKLTVDFKKDIEEVKPNNKYHIQDCLIFKNLRLLKGKIVFALILNMYSMNHFTCNFQWVCILKC